MHTYHFILMILPSLHFFFFFQGMHRLASILDSSRCPVRVDLCHSFKGKVLCTAQNKIGLERAWLGLVDSYSNFRSNLKAHVHKFNYLVQNITQRIIIIDFDSISKGTCINIILCVQIQVIF